MARLPCSFSSNLIIKLIFLYLILLINKTLAISINTKQINNINNNNSNIDYLEIINSTIITTNNNNNNNNDNGNYQRVLFKIYGKNINQIAQIKTTTNLAKTNTLCTIDNNNNNNNGLVDLKNINDNNSYKISEIELIDYKSALYELIVPKCVNVNHSLYLCISYNNNNNNNDNNNNNYNEQHTPIRWYHQGPTIKIPLSNSDNEYNCFSNMERSNNIRRVRRQMITTTMPTTIIDNPSQVFGLRLEHTEEGELADDGVPDLMADRTHTIRLFGENFVENMYVTFTTDKGVYGGPCEYPVVKGFLIDESNITSESVKVDIILPPFRGDADTYYICIKRSTDNKYTHQGAHKWLQIKVHTPLLPLWASIAIILMCLTFSSLFSGLNLGLMALDRTELRILCNIGSAKEQKYAKTIQPVREHGNYLLCSILLGNVFVNSIFTILLDGLTSGLIAVIFSTLAIVLFGEITPQAICSRHGLAVGAKTIFITKFIMILTFPLAYPVSKFLDCILGEEIGAVYNRERLKELVKITTGENDLDKDEVNIISGALELRKKTVADVMTKIEDVFMLDYEAILDFETVSEIMKSGYSRVPVYEKNRQNIVTMLYIKDLAFVDPDDNTPLKTLCQFYQNPINFVFEDVTLDVMFKIFKEGNKGHMAFVHRVNNEGEGDPFYETIGLITLEDVIEELIQAEIMDETDVVTDNRTKRRRNGERRQDFSYFAERRGESNKIRISPQMTLVAFQFLSTSIEHFLPSVISETILKRLLKQDVIYHIKKCKEWRTDPSTIIYQQGKPADYFVLILEGHVEVNIGKENLTFEGGPFTYFGTQALIQNIGVAESPSGQISSTLGSLDSLNLDAMLRHTFQPDYTVRASTEVIYLKIKRSLYLAAKRATLMERSQRDNNNEHFDEEVDKILHYLEDEDESSGGGKRTPARKQSKTTTTVPTTTTTTIHGSNHQLSQNTSPRTPSSLYSNMSPPHRLSQRDINGSIKSSPVDDVKEVEEETKLLDDKNS